MAVPTGIAVKPVGPASGVMVGGIHRSIPVGEPDLASLGPGRGRTQDAQET